MQTVVGIVPVVCGKIFLKAENPNYPNLIPTNSLVIQGIAKQVMKKIG